jgi:phosphatidylserine/phosphatidylglycerophosphate/cardiolipin synthase-like enzyme
MTFAFTLLEQGKQQAQEIGSLLADFLAQARASLHLAIYDFHLSDPVAAPVVKALHERARAGVEIRIVYDAGKPITAYTAANVVPPSPATADFIRSLGPGVQSKPITGGHGPVLKLMHQKFMVRDSGTSTAAVWTGSANFTDDSWTLQENNIVRVDSPELATLYERDFEDLWLRGDIDRSGCHDGGVVKADGMTLTVAFSPGEGSTIDHEIARRLSAARKRIKLCSMLITSGGILGALGDVLHHGQVAQFDGVYDRTQMEAVFRQWQGTPVAWKIRAFEEVAKHLAGKRSTPYSPSSRHDFMHNKALVVDDTVITGSYNLSRSATLNAENMLMITDHARAEQFGSYVDGLARKFASARPAGAS